MISYFYDLDSPLYYDRYNINKMTSDKNGFVNILFNKEGKLSVRRQREKDDIHIRKYMDEHIFIPRNRIKNIRIIKFSNGSNFNTAESAQIKRMFVDGSQVRQLSPKRGAFSQNSPRKIVSRGFSPQLEVKRQISTRQNCSFFDEKQDESKNEKLQDSGEVLVLPIQDKSLAESTASSESRSIRVTFRYRRSEKKPQFKTMQPAIQIKKQLFKFYSNPPNLPENISAKAYIVFEPKNQNKTEGSFFKNGVHVAYNTKINLQIASLTKIMTCILSIQICSSSKIDIVSTKKLIGHFQTKVQGTSAEICCGEEYTIQQLLYGLMLPSGNDASLALSVFCGQLLYKNKEDQKQNLGKKLYSRRFVNEMNKKCIELGMKRTIYSNSHGLPNALNKSCASDLAMLISYALKNELFRTIVSCKSYEGNVFRHMPEGFIETRTISWQNTHRLVQTKPQIYLGIKTGTTEAAGPCLASLLSFYGRQFIIIVLNSRSPKWRYKDTELLRQWLCKKQQISSPSQ